MGPGALFVSLTLAAGCERGGGLSAAGIETIDIVPARVLTIEELAARVRRSRSELGVRIEGVQVVGVLVRRATPCDLGAPHSTCDIGPEGKYLFAHAAGDPTSATMSVLLQHSPELIQVGERYVLDGAVETAPDAPQRWQFRGQVLARVRD